MVVHADRGGRGACVLLCACIVWAAACQPAHGDYTNNILVTGYWYPTNEMLAQFSTGPLLNPDGWRGRNWEDRGYDIYSYFPTYPEASDLKGEGDFEVDYQDTSADFWSIADAVHPVAILSFGRGKGPWEIEYRATNHTTWRPDYLAPYSPSPCPPDSSMPAGGVRYTTLPVTEIESAVDTAAINVDAWVDFGGNTGNFLCNYMFYHDTWYQSLHADPSDPYQCFSAGFIHVAETVTVDQGIAATEITLREIIEYVNALVPIPPIHGDANFDGDVNQADLDALLAHFGTAEGMTWAQGDFTDDAAVDDADLSLLLANYAAPGAPSVPEPATLALLALGAVAALTKHRRTVRARPYRS